MLDQLIHDAAFVPLPILGLPALEALLALVPLGLFLGLGLGRRLSAWIRLGLTLASLSIAVWGSVALTRTHLEGCHCQCTHVVAWGPLGPDEIDRDQVQGYQWLRGLSQGFALAGVAGLSRLLLDRRRGR